MKWEEIRTQYPDSWVLIEALKAESIENRREIEEMSVISEYTNSIDTWKGYKAFQLYRKKRSMYGLRN